MSARKVSVSLTPGQRERLEVVVRRGSHSALAVRHARILLELDEGGGGPRLTYAQAAARAGVCVNTVVRVVKAWAASGGDVEAVVCAKKRLTPPVEPKLTGEVEAWLIATACDERAVPEGYKRWSLRLLESKVKLDPGLPDLDHSTIGRALKKTGFVLT